MLHQFSPRQNAPLPEGCETLFTAVLSDALDAVGTTNQAMAPGIRPLDDELRLCGRVRTGLYAEAGLIAPGTNPYELEIAIVDDLKPGDVAVLPVAVRNVLRLGAVCCPLRCGRGAGRVA